MTSSRLSPLSADLARPEPWVPTRWRLSAAAFVVLMAMGLYLGGAQPVAVGLFAPPWDKLAHALTFALIGAASALASGRRGLALLLCGLVGALLVGGMDEWHQRFLPGRSAGWDDLLADAVGGLLGALAVRGLTNWQARRLASPVGTVGQGQQQGPTSH